MEQEPEIGQTADALTKDDRDAPLSSCRHMLLCMEGLHLNEVSSLANLRQDNR